MTEHGCAWGLTKAECYACQTEKENIMPDIVDRLRAFNPHADYEGERKRNNAIIDSAIAEIERLRAEIEEDAGVMRALRRHREKAETEVERLRTRIQDEVERNEKRANTLHVKAQYYDMGSNDRARLRSTEDAYQNVARELSHILED